MMPGGTQEAYTHIKDIVEKVAAQVNDGPCVTYIGPGGAGNFVKMVHNGIEYGDMQLISEAYDVLRTPGGFQPTRSARCPFLKEEQGAQAAARLCTFRTRAVACPGGRAYGWALAGQASEIHYCELFGQAAGRFAACSSVLVELSRCCTLPIYGLPASYKEALAL